MRGLTPERARTLAASAGGLLAVLAAWWLATLTVLADARIPTPPEVVRSVADSGWGFYSTHFSVTVEEAAVGFLYGNLAALVLASVVLLVPFAEPVIMQVAVISYCLPIVAVAPVLYLVIGVPDAGERSGTAVALAALSVFFTTVVGALLGFRSAERTSLDVISVYGGGRFQQLRRVQLVSALPAIISALQIAAPAAFLGAILGEYVGGIERGVGLALKIAQQNVDVAQAWGIGFGCAAVAGAAYAAFGLLARLVTPWSRGVPG
ncbi:ABC transporter permease [Nocardioides campestrisoli]|uniref:ABC transporter permease n=1 Tax=Nocardioides campestrisoli TaxID=2736757 RepID=UPI0015E640A2|nr:ABC transporter permease subunit [Nocardioides campestrisoli]